MLIITGTTGPVYAALLDAIKLYLACDEFRGLPSYSLVVLSSSVVLQSSDKVFLRWVSAFVSNNDSVRGLELKG